MEAVILANGKFPEHKIPLEYLVGAKRVICCDGAAEGLVAYGLEPFAIVGDCDSLSPMIKEKYGDRVYVDSNQETNDLTKSVTWCIDRGYKDLAILGATGKREDHTLGNISLLAEYAVRATVKILTDTGVFYPVLRSSVFESVKGQQVSIFSVNPATEISSSGLKYPLHKRKLGNWWEATLNEALGDHFSIDFMGGPLIIFMCFAES